MAHALPTIWSSPTPRRTQARLEELGVQEEVDQSTLCPYFFTLPSSLLDLVILKSRNKVVEEIRGTGMNNLQTKNYLPVEFTAVLYQSEVA
jgi:hypothetical protein